MARKPNYKFERMERERIKAEKKAARAKAKAEKAANREEEKVGEATTANDQTRSNA
jgi:hypothetical protein